MFNLAVSTLSIHNFTLDACVSKMIHVEVQIHKWIVVTFSIHTVALKMVFILVSHKFSFYTSGTSVWMHWCFRGRVFELAETLAQTRYKP